MIREITMRASDEAYLNGHPTERLADNVNISYAYVEGESLLMGLKESRSLRLGLYVRHAGAVLCARSARRRRRAGPLLDPLRPGPLQHGGGGGVRHQHTIEMVKRLREMSPL